VNRQSNLRHTRFKLIKTDRLDMFGLRSDMSGLGPDMSDQTGSRVAEKKIGSKDDKSRS
jgi:hypothetical protein